MYKKLNIKNHNRLSFDLNDLSQNNAMFFRNEIIALCIRVIYLNVF